MQRHSGSQTQQQKRTMQCGIWWFARRNGRSPLTGLPPRSCLIVPLSLPLSPRPLSPAAEMERVYVDSRELAATLRRQFPPTKRQLQREEMAGRQHHVALTVGVQGKGVGVLCRRHGVHCCAHAGWGDGERIVGQGLYRTLQGSLSPEGGSHCSCGSELWRPSREFFGPQSHAFGLRHPSLRRGTGV